MTDTDEKTASLLAAIWQRNRALVEERLDLLERAATSAVAGGLIEAQRQEAGGVAHKMAGSLGMYGYVEGTSIARQIELMLLGDGAPDAVRLSALVAELRRVVFPEG
jgi:HPt (histidine-containing phosphotransfer) domain-containing protein